MNSPDRNRHAGLTSTVFLLLFAGGCAKSPPEPAAQPAAQMEKLISIDRTAIEQGHVKWESARMEPLSEELRVNGRIGLNENRTSRVGAVVEGRVVEILAGAGDTVRSGQVLARLVSHEVHNARSEYAKARAELNRKRAEQEYAANAKKRAERLYELKAISLEHLQRSDTDLRGSEQAVKAAQAEVIRIEEELRHFGLSARGAEEEYTRETPGEQHDEEESVPVPSPLDGTVMKRMISPGAVVTPSNDLMIISDLSSLWINAEVPERYLSSLKVGRNVRVSVPAYPDRNFPGRIAAIGDTLNPETRTVQVRCEAGNTERMLKPEMYATISFVVGETRDSLMIPAGAIQDLSGQATVFLWVADTRFRPLPVRIGRTIDDRSEVLEGLKPGDQVVVAGSFLLKSELLKRQMAGD